MKKINLLVASLVCFLFSSAIFAEEKESEFTVKAQLRPRAEYRHGVINPIDNGELASSFISNRARISMAYSNGLLSMGLSAQDVSIWGERPQVDAAPTTTGINEAWAKINYNGFFAQLGRQQLSYDDDRILGTLDWNQAGRFHDVLKLGFENKDHQAHLILAYNQHHQIPNLGTFYAGGQPYKSMQTLWYKHSFTKTFNLSVLAMNLGFESGTVNKPESKYMQTIGTNLSYKYDDLSLYGTAYMQTGQTILNKDILAYMMAAKLNYKVTNEFSAALGIDYLSGQKSGTTQLTAFNPLYGTHHKFYGTMDYFYASAFGDKGLMDLNASLIFKPVKKLLVDLTYHYFASEQDITVGGNPTKGLGSEIDLTLSYPIRPYIGIQGGYSMMFGTDAFFQIKGGSKDKVQNWAFLSLNINPEIFSSKK